jgi:hypothetical protein
MMPSEFAGLTMASTAMSEMSDFARWICMNPKPPDRAAEPR